MSEGGIDMIAEQRVLENIRVRMEALPGHTGFFYRNLTTGLTFGVRTDEVFGAASVSKLPLYLHILAECSEGHISMHERLTVTDADKVPICGALTLFTGDVEADIQTLCRLMISISDNTATNRLIDRCGIEQIHHGFCRMGLSRTQLTRKLFDRSAGARGLRNVINLEEIGMLLEGLYRGTFVHPSTSREAIDTLLLQQVDHKLNGRICGEVPIAHKTGEDDGLSNDVGIVYAPSPFVICFAGENTDVYQWEDLMRNAAYELYEIQKES